MDFAKGLAVALFGAAVAIMPQAVVALPATEVAAIAEQITVPIDGPDSGTGVIIDRKGNTYTIVTNCHVVELAGNYIVQTQDKQRHFVSNSQITCLGDVDLAILRFTSTQNYRVASLGDAKQLTIGTKVYLAGWIVTPKKRELRFTDGHISGRSAPQQGYSLIYSNLAQPGMSGGSLLDEDGHVVGINGRAISIPQTGGVEYWGIPSNTLVEEASKEGISLKVAKSQNSHTTQPSEGDRFIITTTSRLMENPYGFTFTTPREYGDCLQDILLLYEDKERLKRQGRQSSCLEQIFQKHADAGLSWTLARELIEAANMYATHPPLTVKLFPPGGLRSRIYENFGIVYEIDK